MSVGSIRTPKSTRPRSSRSDTSSAFPLWSSNLTMGYVSENLRIARATTLMASVSPHPILTVPITSFPAEPISVTAVSASCSISTALRLRSIPSSVRTILLLPRSNSFAPSSFSSRVICLEMFGWLRLRLSAAAEMLPSSAMARK